MDVESGDYETDELGIETSRSLQRRHPQATLYAFRIGYKAVEALGGNLERTGIAWSAAFVRVLFVCL